MKKYLNKGLLYSWFNCAKAPIIIGIFIWGVIANINYTRQFISVER